MSEDRQQELRNSITTIDRPRLSTPDPKMGPHGRTFGREIIQNGFAQAVVIYCMLNVLLLFCFCPIQRSVTDEFRPAELTDKISGKLHKPWSWWLARGYLRCSPAPDVVVFGSSQMGSAQATVDAKHLKRWIDVITHRRIFFLEEELKRKLPEAPPPVVLSLAMPGAVISDEYLMSETLFTARSHPRCLVITVAPRDFIDDTLPSPAATDQFKFYGRFVELGKLEPYAYSDPWARLDFKLKQLPGRVLGSQLQASVKADQPASTSGATDVLQAVTAATTDPSPNQWVVPPAMPATWTDNTLEYKFRFKGPNMSHYQAQMEFFKTWLTKLQQSNMAIIVVAMPSMEMNRKLLPYSFWQKFRADLAEQCSAHRADWLDLSDNTAFEKKDYLDTVHLNASGAEKLMPILATEIVRSKRLSK